MASVTSLKWQKRFSDLADVISTWSIDPSTKVGAVIVTESCKIVGVGYNGMFAGMDDSLINTSREFKLAHTIHAEINAFANMQIYTNENLYIFVSKPMCSECAKHAVLNNIKGVYYNATDDKTFNERWNNDTTRAVLKRMNINYTIINKG